MKPVKAAKCFIIHEDMVILSAHKCHCIDVTCWRHRHNFLKADCNYRRAVQFYRRKANWQFQ